MIDSQFSHRGNQIDQDELRANRSRFDGQYFIGVSSTGIYCRSVCRVKPPKKEYCTLYPSASAAEAAGFRPCRRCRPELAPGLPMEIDNAWEIAQKAAAMIAENHHTTLKIADLATQLGITDRHLRRAFTAHFGASPAQYLRTCRLLLAKSLLADTKLSITEVALTSGFSSVRRFNDIFKKYYRATPSSFRGRQKKSTDNEAITLTLGYRPPYAWDELIGFLAGRAIPGVEQVADDTYSRTALITKGDEQYRGWISVANKPKNNSISITISETLLPVLAIVLTKIRRLFDLDCDPYKIEEKLLILNELTSDLYTPGLRLPGCFDPFEISVRAILGQQITVKAARTLAMRFAHTFGEPIDTPFAELQYTFPTSKTVYHLKQPIGDQLGPLGVTGIRARAIYSLAEAIETGAIDFTAKADTQAELQKLLKLPGFGPWTVQYVAMRAYSWPDAFPHTDYGVKKALTGLTAKEILAVSEKWKPWRSYATLNLWNSLKPDNGK